MSLLTNNLATSMCIVYYMYFTIYKPIGSRCYQIHLCYRVIKLCDSELSIVKFISK